MPRVPLLALGAVLALPFASSLAPCAEAVGLTSIAQTLESTGTADAAFIRRGKIRKRVVAGYKVVVVVGDDADTNEVDHVDVSIEALNGGPEPSQSTVSVPLLELNGNGNKRFVLNGDVFSAGAVGSSYQVTSVMRDASGAQVGEADVRTIEVESDGEPRVRTVRIRQLDATNFKISAVIVGDSEQEVAAVSIQLTDLIGNPAAPEELSLTTPVRYDGKATFFDQTLTFDDPSGATDEPYGVVVNLFDSNNVSLGASDYEIVVEGLEVVPEPPSFDDVATVDNTAAFLTDAGIAATSAAASGLGMVVDASTVQATRSAGGGVLFTANTEDGGLVLRTIGGGSISFGDSADINIDSGSTITVSGDVSSGTTWMVVYDGQGNVVAEDFEMALCGAGGDDLPLKAATEVDGDSVTVSFKYGDVIMGSMPLDNFYD